MSNFISTFLAILLGGKRVSGTAPTDNQVLTFDSATDLWTAETASGGATVSAQQIVPTNSQTTTSTSLATMTNGELTLANRTGGMAQVILHATIENTSATALNRIALLIDSTDESETIDEQDSASVPSSVSTDSITDLDGGTVTARWRVSTGTATLTSGTQATQLSLFEVS